MSSPDTHVLLSPSSSHRWLVCTPSAILESEEPSVTSPYAAEGTDAHALAEIKLLFATNQINDAEFITRFESLKNNSEYYNEEFEEYVNDYRNEVLRIMYADYKDIKVSLYLEERVKFDDIVPNGAGTSDAVIVGPDFIHIIDLKFGKGVEVSAINNSQLRLYALGAIKTHLRECNCKEVKMTIIQPRLNHYSTDIMSITDLNDWAINYVKPRAELAYQGKGEIVPGEHCKFCKRKGKCKKLADKQLEVAKSEFKEAMVDDMILEPANLSPDVLSKILKIAPKFIDWFKDVEKYAVSAAINGEIEIPGYKIVEGRSVRIITDENAVMQKLQESGFSEDDYLKPREMQGITTLEKLVGKKLFNELCGDYIVKPAGKLTLVEESDNRPSVELQKLNGSEFEIKD